MKNHLIIMAKRPSMGRVKTRLAAEIGNMNAYKFFNNNLKNLMLRFGQSSKFKLHIATTPKASVDDRFWSRYGNVNVFDQGQGDLGDRMQHVFEHVAKAYKGKNILIIGSDIPYIKQHHIINGFKALGRKKTCFGASDDGGYWLVGQRSSPKITKLFDNVRWSTQHTLADTTNNIPPHQIAYIETLNDVDELEDYNDYMDSLRC
ncbi:MAG: glycosyltransferase [Rhizobiales bacterium]|nr:glycosyltransferase [Hyphomicrobiales bacterium]